MNGRIQGTTLEVSSDGVPLIGAKHVLDNDAPLEWEELVLTPDKIEYLWEQVKRFPIIFDDYGKGDKDAFIAKLMSPRNAFIDIGPGVGLACLMNIRTGLDATAHIVMFDRRLKGREPVIKSILRYAFDKLKLRRITAMISDDAYLAVALAKRLGYKHEGTLRQAMRREGRFVDVHIYGLLEEELQF